MIDLATGAKIAEYYNDGVTTDDRQYMNFSIPANPTAIDEDGDGYIDMVYVGDVGGQLWKFEPEVTADTTTPVRYKYWYAFSEGEPSLLGFFSRPHSGRPVRWNSEPRRLFD